MESKEVRMNKKRITALGVAALLVILVVGNLMGTKELPNERKKVNAEERFSLDSVKSSLNHLDENGSAVYFTSDISSNGMMAVYKALKWNPTGKVAVKISTGEPPASNYLRPELIKELVQSVSGTIVECNTAYGGSRTETAMHRQVAKDHGFTDIADVDILDADGSMQIPVTGGNQLETNYVGSHFENYNSYLVLSHFKGHAMAGFGGAIKNISIGLGSKEGKCLIHTGGRSHTSPWGGDQTAFTESMAEAGKAVSDYLGNGDRITYINVLNNISIDCDCDGNPAEPDIHDIGILASSDPVAIDQAAIDLCFAAEGSESLKQRVERQNGLHTLEHGEEIGLGSRAYNLINIQGETPSETNTPAVTDKPSETNIPTVTGGPSETNPPTVTGGPSETNPPTVTGGPSETNPPAVTGGPSETNPPAVTGEPSETNPPAVTGEPSETNTPAVTDGPSETPSDGKSVTERDSEEQVAKAAMGKAKIKKLKATGKKRKIRISWKKVNKATGYQIQISKTRKFKKRGIFFNKKVKKTSVKASGKKIKKKKTYYVRVRAYVSYTNKAGEKHRACSSWAKKKVKIK